MIKINKRFIGFGQPAYIIAEMSANHHQDFHQAVKIIKAAKETGADAVKLQTYTPDTITVDCDNDYFRIRGGTPWKGKNLYKLYGKTYMPWEWQPKLKKIASKLGIDLFSTPYDCTAVDFLEEMDVPAYKVASFELIDIPLLRKITQTGKPIIMSTGMATLAEIDEAINVIREAGGNQLALLKCTSVYPAPPEEMNLRAIPHLADTFDVPVGLSDHTLGIAVPVAAVALGACIIEKHLTLSRGISGPDKTFSLEPREFKEMVGVIRTVEKAFGEASYKITEKENACRLLRRSLFVVKDIKKGEKFTKENIKSIRPGYGLHTRYLDKIIGKPASKDIKQGSPLTWDMVKKTA